MILKSIIVGAALLSSAAPLFAQSDVSPPSAEQMEAAMTTAAAFAERVASSNQFEIQSSELAQQKSQNAEVMSFAEQMIADHTAATEKFTAAASSESVTVATTLMPDHQEQLDSLNEASADQFDQAYLAAQVAAHVEAVDLFGGYAERGPEGDLKTFAAETLPILQNHLTEVQALANQ